VTLLRGVGSQTAASNDAAVRFLPHRVDVLLAGKRLLIETGDASLLPPLFVSFGGDDERDEPPFFHAIIEDAMLRVALNGNGAAPRDLFFGLDLPGCPFRASGSTITFADDGTPQFTIEGDAVRIHDTPRWRLAVSSMLIRAFLHSIDDVVFLHAAAAGIESKGILFVGNQNAGKSTIALALAAHGANFLSDEFGCYDPKRHELVPYRRPVGIRQGPKAAAIARALSANRTKFIEADDSLRVNLADLIPLSPQRRLPLHAVVFIDGFAEKPAIRFVDPGRSEVGMLQTLYSSLSNAPAVQRTFELVRLLSRSRVAYLRLGDPDETALFLQEEFGS